MQAGPARSEAGATLEVARQQLISTARPLRAGTGFGSGPELNMVLLLPCRETIVLKLDSSLSKDYNQIGIF